MNKLIDKLHITKQWPFNPFLDWVLLLAILVFKSDLRFEWSPPVLDKILFIVCVGLPLVMFVFMLFMMVIIITESVTLKAQLNHLTDLRELTYQTRDSDDHSRGAYLVWKKFCKRAHPWRELQLWVEACEYERRKRLLWCVFGMPAIVYMAWVSADLINLSWPFAFTFSAVFFFVRSLITYQYICAAQCVGEIVQCMADRVEDVEEWEWPLGLAQDDE